MAVTYALALGLSLLLEGDQLGLLLAGGLVAHRLLGLHETTRGMSVVGMRAAAVPLREKLAREVDLTEHHGGEAQLLAALGGSRVVDDILHDGLVGEGRGRTHVDGLADDLLAKILTSGPRANLR